MFVEFNSSMGSVERGKNSVGDNVLWVHGRVMPFKGQKMRARKIEFDKDNLKKVAADLAQKPAPLNHPSRRHGKFTESKAAKALSSNYRYMHVEDAKWVDEGEGGHVAVKVEVNKDMASQLDDMQDLMAKIEKGDPVAVSVAMDTKPVGYTKDGVKKVEVEGFDHLAVMSEGVRPQIPVEDGNGLNTGEAELDEDGDREFVEFSEADIDEPASEENPKGGFLNGSDGDVSAGIRKILEFCGLNGKQGENTEMSDETKVEDDAKVEDKVEAKAEDKVETEGAGKTEFDADAFKQEVLDGVKELMGDVIAQGARQKEEFEAKEKEVRDGHIEALVKIGKEREELEKQSTETLEFAASLISKKGSGDISRISSETASKNGLRASHAGKTTGGND